MMTQNNSEADSSDDVISIHEMLQVLLQHKFRLLLVAFCTVLVTLPILLSIENQYRSTVVLAPVDEESMSGLAGLASQFGGLASLAGVSLGNNQALLNQAKATLAARDFQLTFIRENKVKQILYADDFDAEKNVWEEPNFLVKSLNWLSVNILGKKPTATRYEDINEPIDEDTLDDFNSDIFSLAEDRKTGILTLSMDSPSAELSQKWLLLLVNQLNEHLRQKALSDAEKSILYLEKELEKSSLVSVQQSITRLMETQIKAKMIANTRDYYAYQIIDPPSLADKHTSPKRSVILILVLMLVLSTYSMYLIFSYAKTKQENVQG